MSCLEDNNIFCRTCARTFPRQPLVPLFESANPAINAIRRYQNNKFKIANNDGLPQQICSECLNNFNIMNEFLEVCEQSQDKLQNFMLLSDSDNISIKVENENFVNDGYEDEEFLLDEIVDESEISNQIKIELITESLEIENKAEIDIDDKKLENILLNNLSDTTNDTTSDKKKRQPKNWIKSLQKRDDNIESKNKLNNLSNSDSEGYFNDDFKEDFTLKCEFCSKKFSTFIKLKEHEESRHNKPNRRIAKIMCEMCGEVVEQEYMSDHMDQHFGKKTEYNCETCCRRFYQYKTYKHHVETKHLITTKFHCDICDRGFKMEYNLRNHIKLEHSGDSIPQTKVKPKQTLNRPKANLKCYYCSKKFYNTVTLVRHCTTHNKPDVKDAKHVCNYCSTVFKRADHLKIHINSQHLKSQEFKCSFCDKIFYASFVLNRHIKNSHSGLKNTRVTCEFCNKSLATKEYLNRHIQEFHSKEKTLNCPICDEKFFRRVELKAHSKVHDVIINNYDHKDMIIKEFCSEIVEGDRKTESQYVEYIDPDSADEQVQMIMEYVEEEDIDDKL